MTGVSIMLFAVLLCKCVLYVYVYCMYSMYVCTVCMYVCTVCMCVCMCTQAWRKLFKSVGASQPGPMVTIS